MPSGPRVVQALNSKGRVGLGFVYSDSTSQGTELIIPEVDAQTNAVTWKHISGRFGQNFMEVGQNTDMLGQQERDAFANKTDEPFVGTTDTEVEQKTEEKKHKHDR